jgi:outer membrane beta-barrel protein
MKKHILLKNIIVLGLVSLSLSVSAQENEASSDDAVSEVEAIERELTRSAPVVEDVPVTDAEQKPVTFSTLSELAPFSEVSVLQKRFLPKTGRLQGFVGFSNVVNDPWFFGVGATLKGAYHLNEKWGLEGVASFISNSERQAVTDISKEHNVKPTEFIQISGYYGLHLMWTPIYGKTTWFNQRIVPFDMYFTGGLGSSTVETGSGGSTFHLGTGQLYALTKSMGFRWDLSWNFVQATPNSSTGNAKEGSYNNLVLSAGVSFFFPEAKYR